MRILATELEVEEEKGPSLEQITWKVIDLTCITRL